jgi:excisionase family DNA binding protein
VVKSRNEADSQGNGLNSDKAATKRSHPAPDDPEFLVTMPSLCQKLDLPVKWVRRETTAGRLPAIRIGRRICFNVEAIKEFLRDRASRKNQQGNWLQ